MKKELKEIELNQERIKVIINRKNNKNTYIKVVEGNIVVNTHFFMLDKDIERLLILNANKILKILNKQKSQKLLDNQFRYLGKIYELVIRPGRKFTFEKTKDTFYIVSNYDIDKTIEKVYKKEAEILFPQLLTECLKEFNKYYHKLPPKLVIRKMRRRFGTCYYTKDQICLNSQLMKYEIDLIKYVIYHELVHFIEHNHSKKFYACLEKVCPNYKELKKKLNSF